MNLTVNYMSFKSDLYFIKKTYSVQKSNTMKGIPFRTVFLLQGGFYLIILLTCCKCAHSSSAAQEESQSVADSLKSLTTGSESGSPPPQQPSWIVGNTTVPIQPVLQNKRFLLNQKLNELLMFSNNPKKRFEAQHTIEGNSSLGLDSFQYFSKGAEVAKTYLVDLNAKLYKAGVLPQHGEFEMWFNEADKGKKTINILDEKWKKLSEQYDLAQNSTDTKTWRVGGTRLTFQTSRHPTYHFPTRLDIIAEKIDGYVTSSKGEQADLNKVAAVNGSQRRAATFTIPELKYNAEFLAQLWKDFDLPPATQPKIVLNEHSPWFREKMREYRELFLEYVIRPRTGITYSQAGGPVCYDTRNTNGSECVVIVRLDSGEVDIIKAEEFYNVFKNKSWNVEDKQQLAKLAQNNFEKIVLWRRWVIGEDEEEMGKEDKRELEELRKNIHYLIKREVVMDHVMVVDKVVKVQDLEWAKYMDTPKYLDYTERSLRNVDAKVSNTKVLTALTVSQSSQLEETYFGGNISQAIGVGTAFLSKTIVNGIFQRDKSTLKMIGEKFGYNSVPFSHEGGSGNWSGGEGLVAESRKFEKTTKVLGKVASPIGAQTDFALGIFSLYKSIDRLRNLGDEFKRKDVIAEIVQDSISVATFSSALAVSVAFPPAAPAAAMIAVAVHLLSRLAENLYKTRNEVDRMNTEVPQLLNETDDLYKARLSNWGAGGERKLDYMDILLAEKRANDLVVQRNLDFLMKNKDIYRAIVSPSQTLEYDGGCKLTKTWCLNSDCWHKDNIPKIEGERCDRDGPCSNRGYGNYTCKTFREHRMLSEDRVSVDYHQLNCTCNESLVKEHYLKPRLNSLVDFRQKRKLFWERSVPKDLKEATFLCKPGSTKDMGWKTSERERREEYLCDSAIGLVLPVDLWEEGQVVLIKLEDGDDTVFLNEEDDTPSMFRMGGCGRKKFFGGGGKNEFVFGGEDEGNCSRGMELEGNLRGGDLETDRIILMGDFSRGRRLSVDFREGYLKRVGEGEEEERIVVTFQSVEELIGREGESEVVIVNCTTRRLSLKGGNVNEYDRVVIPWNDGSGDDGTDNYGNMTNWNETFVNETYGKSTDKCLYKLTVMLGAYSSLESKATKGEITLLVDSPFEPELQANFDIYPGSLTRVNVRFLKTGCRFMVHEEIAVDDESGQNILLSFKSIEESVNKSNNESIYEEDEPVKILFRGQNLTREELAKDIIVHFGETPYGSPFSEMRISANRSHHQTLLYHLLPPRKSHWGHGPLARYGSETYMNVFEVSGNDWVVHGGPEKDVFLLKARPSELHGGPYNESIEDEVWLQRELNESISLDLTSRNFTGIGSVRGAVNKRLNVTCDCNTTTVIVFGGPSRESPNVVRIPKGQKCEKRGRSPPLQIVAMGSSLVEIFGEVEESYRDGVGVTAMSSSGDGKYNLPLSFGFEGGSGNLSGVQLTLELTHKNWTLESGRRVGGQHVICELVGENRKLNRSEYITLKFATGGSSAEGFLRSPIIQVIMKDKGEIPGQVIIEKGTGTLRIMYSLEEIKRPRNNQTVEGFWGIPNVFRIPRTKSIVRGGMANDVFYVSIRDGAYGIHIDGGEGDNTLILERSIDNDDERTFGVNLDNLEKGTFGYGRYEGTLKSIQNVVGIENIMDYIVTGCSTRIVNGRGGMFGKEDVVIIDDSKCERDMDLTVDTGEGYTMVTNKATRGRFLYNVRDFATTEITMKVLDGNEHLLNFHFDPWTEFRSVEVVKNESGEIWMKFELNESKISRSFKMASVNNETGEFHNPIFRFNLPRSPVTSDIRVANESGRVKVKATFILEGRGLLKSEQIVGLAVNENRFLINAIVNPSGASGGTIIGSSKSYTNQFWIIQLNSSLYQLDGGKRGKTCRNCTNNYLNFNSTMLPTDDLIIDLDMDNGWLMKAPNSLPNTPLDKAEGEVIINRIQNIAEFHGRDHPTCRDTAYVTCHTKRVHKINQVFIRSNMSSKCPPYNLLIVIGRETKVKFIGEEKQGNESVSTPPISHKFHYVFTIPVSFNLEKVDPLDKQADNLMTFATHTYHLPITLDDLTSIRFDAEDKRLFYSLNSTGAEYSHYMIANTMDTDEFYQQPVMVTQDNFKILVSRTGSIILSLGATNSSWSSLELIQKKIIPSFVRRSRALKVTIMVHTRNEFLYIGEDASSSQDRNVLQNRNNLISHLVGSGGPDTIYDIKSLNKSIYIYSGLEKDSKQICIRIGVDCPYHTIDLSDAIMPFRMINGTKFIPTVVQRGKDLVLYINFEDKVKSSVNITIVNGAMETISKRFQVLIHTAMLHFDNDTGTKESWRLDPTPVVVPKGFVYSVSALDLEDGHYIKLNMTKSKGVNASTFTAAQFGHDLYLTDIKAVNFQKYNQTKKRDTILKEKKSDDGSFEKATTVIITDFFKSFKFKPKRDYKFDNFKDSSPFPTSLNGVMVSLPGLNVILNGSKVLMEITGGKEEKKKGRRKRDVGGQGNSDKRVLQEAPIVEWKCVLHDVEDELMMNMPDIPRVYYKSECVDRFWLIVGIVTGVLFGGIFFIFLVVKRKKIREMIRRLRAWLNNVEFETSEPGENKKRELKVNYDVATGNCLNCVTKKGIEENGGGGGLGLIGNCLNCLTKKGGRKGGSSKSVSRGGSEGGELLIGDDKSLIKQETDCIPQFIPESGDKNTDEFLELFEKWADGHGFIEEERKHVFRQALPSAAGIAWWSSRSRDILNEDVGWERFKRDFQESMESMDVTRFGDDGTATTLQRWGGFSVGGRFCVLTLHKPREISDLVKLVGESDYEIGKEEVDNYAYIDELDEDMESVYKVVDGEEVEKDVRNVRTISASSKLISIRTPSKIGKTEQVSKSSKEMMVEGAILVKK